jgi:hypothetical protein
MQFGFIPVKSPFIKSEPALLKIAGKYWFLLVWLPYWILNILGKE